MRSWIYIPLMSLLVSCASTTPFDGRIEILSTSRSQPLEGALCEVETGSGKWTVTTPGSVQVGQAQGELRVVCNKEGYRSSEVLFRGAGDGISRGASRVGVGLGGGFGGHTSMGVSLGFGLPLSTGRKTYPSQVIVDMTPL